MSETIYGLTVKNTREIAHQRTRVAEFPDIPPKNKLGALIALHQNHEILAVARLVAVIGGWTVHSSEDFQWVFGDVIALEHPVPSVQGSEFFSLESQTLAALRLEYGRTVRRGSLGGSVSQKIPEGA